MPWPKARCGFGLRPTSSRSGSANVRRVAVRAADGQRQQAAGRQRRCRRRRSAAVVIRLFSCSGLSKRSSSSIAVPSSAGSATQPLPLVAVASSSACSAVADQVGRRLVAGVEQEDAVVQQLGFGEPLAVDFALDQPRQHVDVRVARPPPPRRDQVAQHRARSRAPRHCRAASTSASGAGSSADRIASDQSRSGPRSAVRHVEQVADHLDRDARARSRRSGRARSRRRCGRAGRRPARPRRRRMRAIARWFSAPISSRRTRVCSGGSLKTRLVVWCSNSGESPNLAPNSVCLSELARVSRYSASTSS